MRQMEICFAGSRNPLANELDVDILLGLLRRSSRRLTAGQISNLTGWTDRKVRAVAEAAGGAVLSAPGIAGYRLAATTPVASYYETERSRYRSQIHAMSQRLIAMDRAVHQPHTTKPGDTP